MTRNPDKERDLAYMNGQLRRKKRNSIEMSLTFSHFKKRKLEKVGDRTHFDAHRRVLVDEDKGAGLQSCFSDVILNQMEELSWL